MDQSEMQGDDSAVERGIQKNTSSNSFLRVGKYALVRALAISVTIVVGVFIVILITNKSGQIDQIIRGDIVTQSRREFMFIDTDEEREALNQYVEEEEERAGLNLPYLQRHFRWTINALTLNWGEVLYTQASGIYISKQEMTNTRDIVLDRFPNTLLLVGAADLLIFLIGIPLALSLSRKHGGFIDRLFTVLAPISSIPSWVFGIMLLLIFAVELRYLPYGGMFDSAPPETKLEYVPIVLRHMILPVAAILLSLLFQLVYTWRTYFLIYSDEDYVELAKAKGLNSNDIGKKHILRPSSPFIITTFSLTLVGFWQMTTALELVFNWPGIGKLYIDSLPHFWGESMFPGELMISIAIVVIFAYLLGLLVLVLDLVYAWLDPRVRISTEGVSVAKKSRGFRFRPFAARKPKWKHPDFVKRRDITSSRSISLQNVKVNISGYFQWAKRVLSSLYGVFRELIQYPSASVSLVIIFILFIGSIYALVVLPYSEIGSRWYTDSVRGNTYVPRFARPEWMNLFKKGELLSTEIQSSQDDTANKVVEPGTEGAGKVDITFQFDYEYDEIPEEVFVNFNPEFDEKRPFIVMTWVTPDQREIEFKALSIDADKRIDLVDYLPNKFSQNKYYDVGNADEESSLDENAELAILFTDPESDSLTPIQGTYQLLVAGRTFEENSDLDAELVLLGQVYGMAGTDYMRRDLLVPLLWGMPFALIIGLLGATLTTLISMVVAATGVWYGGWVDGMVQRITEVNMIFPILALGVLFYALFDVSLWTVIAIIIILNIFGGPTKAFRSAFMQIKEAPYIEAAQAYGASNWRLIRHYMMPRIFPVMIPQLITLIPAFVFLEATLGMFNIHSNLPTWGRVIYEALNYGVSYGSRYWVLQPIALLLLTGFAFAFLGYALDKILNPRLKGL